METTYYIVHDDSSTSLKYKRFIVALRDDEMSTDAGPYQVPRIFTGDEPTQINEYVPADVAVTKRWLNKLGMIAVWDVVYGAYRDAGRDWDPNATVLLQRFPRGYALYIHRKGHKDDPRKDYYLYGSRHVKTFRSPEEFAPHLTWILSGQPMNANGKRDCICKYCDSSVCSQRAVNQTVLERSRVLRNTPPSPTAKLRRRMSRLSIRM